MLERSYCAEDARASNCTDAEKQWSGLLWINDDDDWVQRCQGSEELLILTVGAVVGLPCDMWRRRDEEKARDSAKRGV
jgi:hypothetical protein